MSLLSPDIPTVRVTCTEVYGRTLYSAQIYSNLYNVVQFVSSKRAESVLRAMNDESSRSVQRQISLNTAVVNRRY